MPTLQEILAAKKLAQAKAISASASASAVPVPNPSPTVPSAVPSAVQESNTDAKPVSTPSEVQTTSQPAVTSKPTPQEPPQFAKNLANELKAMAQEQDWLDVEQSANSLNEILSVIFDLPYPPDVFIDECIDNAACALEAQKNRYLHDVLNGKKQSGKRQKASADMSPLQQAIELDKLGDDDIFVFDPLASIGG